ncbi:AP2-like ethylene-responsive transcription factor AIL5 [Forsythia ovata]|uniref:AP2-like ethylene-responsive transcription factor AIL5 n=1 Tax=Forsythia ovata TaxID=205694 RepID=A0ABD1PK73_9LAMI
MDSPQNWLAFSLFQPTNPSGGVVVSGDQENGSGATAISDLSIINGGDPKLEDFLGGSGSGGAAQFNGGVQGLVTDAEIYDSELKTIAASFLRGFSGEQTGNQKQLTVVDPPEPPAKKAVENFGHRTSIYRGVTRHRWTGRYEAHLWDNSCRREGQSRKGRQVYLGGYDKEEKAARAYDLAAIKYWGLTTTTNFPVSNYEKEMEEMKNMTRQEFVASLRRKSSGFSRGASIYRGVTRHHQHGRWQARIGRVAGNKDLYLGTFSTQEEAAEAYDIAAIKFRGLNAVTNFDMSRYDVKSIASSNLPIGGFNNKPKTSSETLSDSKSLDGAPSDISSNTSISLTSHHAAASTLSFGLPIKQDSSNSWSNPANPSTVFQPSNSCMHGTIPFSIDFPTNSSVNETNKNKNKNDEGFFNGNYYQQQQQEQEQQGIATRIALNSNYSNNTYDGSVSTVGNWISPSLHSFQPAKSNLSAFQTPIFGME